MKIYLRSTSKDSKITDKIKQAIKNTTHSIEVARNSTKNKNEYASEDTNNIARSDIFLVEASAPNASIGYEVSYALENNVPTIVIYNDENVFPVLATRPNTKFIVKSYEPANLEKILKESIAEIEDYFNTSFTLNLTPQISDFLNWIAANKKTTRASFVRALIEASLKKNTEYKAFLKKKR